MFKELDILERWYNLNFVNVEQYFQIKSSIVDFYRPKNKETKEGEMPF